jgi:hypothetical protein
MFLQNVIVLQIISQTALLQILKKEELLKIKSNDLSKTDLEK